MLRSAVRAARRPRGVNIAAIHLGRLTVSSGTIALIEVDQPENPCKEQMPRTAKEGRLLDCLRDLMTKGGKHSLI